MNNKYLTCTIELSKQAQFEEIKFNSDKTDGQTANQKVKTKVNFGYL